MVEEKISPSAAFVIQSMLKASKFVSPAFEIKHTGFYSFKNKKRYLFII